MPVQRFTDRWLAAASLTPAAGRVDYADGLCPGLHLRVSVRGTRTFSVMHRAGGALSRATIGRYPNVSLAQARQRARELLCQGEQGRAVATPSAVSEPKGITFGTLVDVYVAKHLRPNTRSWKVVEGTLRSGYVQPLAGRAAASIARGHIWDLIDGIVADGKPQSAISHLTRINMLSTGRWTAT